MQQQHLKIRTTPKTHIAIMRKSWGFTEKILAGKKTVESRWYEHKHDPWDKINEDDIIYFKNAGEPIVAQAKVSKVAQYDNLTPKQVYGILKKYSEAAGIEESELDTFYQFIKDKKYCILIFMKEIQAVDPFKINKSGFGTMSAWLIVDNIEKIKTSIDKKIVQKKMFR